MDITTDVVVVGARVAGASLAAQIGRSGLRVLLVDRARFPSPTLSTHFFRGGHAATVFKELGVLDELLASGSPPLVRDYWYRDGAPSPEIREPQEPGEIGHSLSVRRETLDHVLVKRAAEYPSVSLLEKTRLTGLTRDNGRITGAILNSEGNQFSVQSQLVVGADGRFSYVGKNVDAVAEESAPPYRALFYCYVSGFESPDGGQPDGPEFSVLGDEIAYVFPSDAGVTCIAISVNIREYPRAKANREGFFCERIAAHRGIAERFAATTRESNILGSASDPNFVRVPFGPGWALLGDAGMHQDPWSGRGIDMAAVHSSYLADAILGWMNGSEREDAAMRSYHQRRNDHGLERYRRTVEVAKDRRKLS